MYKFIHYRRFFLFSSLILMILAIAAILTFGFKFGIDFTGGSLMEVSFNNINRPSSQEIIDSLNSLELGEITVQPAGDTGMILRFGPINEEKHQEILTKLRETFKTPTETSATATTDTQPLKVEGVNGDNSIGAISATTESGEQITINPEGATTKETVTEESFESVGPTIGKELRNKSWWAIVLTIICIILYITWAFARISKPVASWKYGVIAIVALLHDIILTCGLFAILGHYFGYEMNTAFIAAVMTIFGYSVNDTIIIFDRIRENLTRYDGEFSAIVNKGLNDTLARSINTVLTVLISLLAIFLFGGASLKVFSLILIVGIASGAYSSIFIASPLLVEWHNWSTKRANKQ